MNKRAAAQYMTKLFGTDQGYVAVAYKDKGESWQECQFEWPKDKTKIVGWAEVHQDANIFICPALRSDPATRKKGDMRPTKWLWADVDWDKVPPDKRVEVEARINQLGAYRVPSGTGNNCHVYIELTDVVSAGDHTKLNTGLRDYLYADNKQADNSLLRLPGTTNWKTESGSPVGQIKGDGTAVDPADLLEIRAFKKARVIADVDAGDWAVVDVSDLPRRIMRMATMTVDEAIARYGNRHEAVWAITGELHRKGLSADQIHTLMEDFPAAVDKREEERGYDLHKDVTKRLAHDIVNDAIFSDDDEMEVVSVEEMTRTLIDEGVEKELLRRAIRRAADQAEAMHGHTEPPPDTSQTLSDALSTPPAPVQYLIDGLVSADGTVVIVGQYKTGKTKMMVASLLTSLADNKPFLGSIPVHVPEGGAIVGHWNLEMSALDLIDKYMRPAGYENPHNVHLANWQGYRLNIMTELGKQHAVEWLKSRGVKVWTIDSWSALCRMCGVDPNDGSEVGQLMNTVLEIKVEAGIQAIFMLAHIARSSADGEKPGTRGASEVDDMVDTRWMFTVDRSDVRFLQAEGRGTQMSAVSLDFDDDTGRSTLGAITRASAATDGMVQSIVKVLQGRPSGLNQSTLVRLVRETTKRGVRMIKDGIVEAEEGGWIVIKDVAKGTGRPEKMHFLANDGPPDDDRKRNATPREVNLAHVRAKK